MPLTIKALQQRIHENNVRKGFYEKEKNIGEMIALMHSELSEALEADRKDRYADMDEEQWGLLVGTEDDSYWKELFTEFAKDTFEDEMADVVIRVMDMCEYRGIDLQRHIEAKMRYNAMRKYKHGKKY